MEVDNSQGKAYAEITADIFYVLNKATHDNCLDKAEAENSKKNIWSANYSNIDKI